MYKGYTKIRNTAYKLSVKWRRWGCLATPFARLRVILRARCSHRRYHGLSAFPAMYRAKGGDDTI